MKKDTYRNLDELGQHLYEKWYAQDWEVDKGRTNIRLIRYLTAVSLILGCYVVIFAR